MMKNAVVTLMYIMEENRTTHRMQGRQEVMIVPEEMLTEQVYNRQVKRKILQMLYMSRAMRQALRMEHKL